MMAEICRDLKPTIKEVTAQSFRFATDNKVTKNAVFQQITEGQRDEWLEAHDDLPDANETYPRADKECTCTDTDDNGLEHSVCRDGGHMEYPGEHGTGNNDLRTDKGCISIDEISKALEDASTAATRPRTRDKDDIYYFETMDENVVTAMSLPQLRTFCNGLIEEGTTTILFAPTNVGKSPLAVQLAADIARTDKVLYLDTELSERQFAKRYTENDERHIFGPNLFRKSLSPKILCQAEDRAQWLLDYILYVFNEEHIYFFVIDNMSTFVLDGTKGDQAGVFMQKLMSLKLDHQITTIVVGHTTKLMECRYPITTSNLYGSSKFGNACDNLLALSRSAKGPNKRYLKELKHREGEIRFGEEHVLELDICKTNGYLHLEPCGCGPESEHLKDYKQGPNGFNEGDEIASTLLQDKEENHLTERELATKYGKSKTFIHNKLMAALDMRSNAASQAECKAAENETELLDDNLPY